MNFFEFTLPCHKDSRGSLMPIEFTKELPFIPKRIYTLTQTPPLTTRGAHYHHQEKEIFVCVSGSVCAQIDSDGKGKKEILLNSPTKAIFVGTGVWHEFERFSANAVLLCLSSTHYMPGEQNYEYDYTKFIEHKKNSMMK